MIESACSRHHEELFDPYNRAPSHKAGALVIPGRGDLVDADRPDPYICRFGFHHVIPQLAQDCTGLIHQTKR